MDATTVKVSVETRERIRALGGDTHEETITAALDALESQRFWDQAEAATQWRASLPKKDQQRLADRDNAVDSAFDGIE